MTDFSIVLGPFQTREIAQAFADKVLAEHPMPMPLSASVQGERVWSINGETVDPQALARVEPKTEPHDFVAGNHVLGCVLCGVTRANAVHQS